MISLNKCAENHGTAFETKLSIMSKINLSRRDQFHGSTPRINNLVLEENTREAMAAVPSTITVSSMRAIAERNKDQKPFKPPSPTDLTSISKQVRGLSPLTTKSSPANEESATARQMAYAAQKEAARKKAIDERNAALVAASNSFFGGFKTVTESGSESIDGSALV